MRSCASEGDGYYQRLIARKARPQLGRTLQDHIMAMEGNLPPRDSRRAKATTPMKRGTPTEVLPVVDLKHNGVLFSTFLQVFQFI